MRFLGICLPAVLTIMLVCQTATAQRPGGGLGPPSGFSRAFPLMRALDADGDGTISKEEINGAVKALKMLDKDGNGKLTANELRPQFGGVPRRGGFGERTGGRFGAGQLVERMMESDSNGDKKISKSEAPDRLKERFDRVDSNSDGFVDEAELKAMTERFGGQRRPNRPGDRRPSRPGNGEDRPSRPNADNSAPRERAASGRRREGEITTEGKPAPDFKLKTVDGKHEAQLASFKGKKPVALLFGSYT